MRLTDIMQHANLAIWAQIAFVLFGIVFLAVVVRTALFGRVWSDRMSSLPLEDDPMPVTAPAHASRTGQDPLHQEMTDV